MMPLLSYKPVAFKCTIVYLTLMKTTVLGVHDHLLVVNHHHCENVVIWLSLIFEIWVCFTHWLSRNIAIDSLLVLRKKKDQRCMRMNISLSNNRQKQNTLFLLSLVGLMVFKITNTQIEVVGY